MTGRIALISLLAAGCAAAVPVAHGAFAGGHSATHGAWHHAAVADGPHCTEEMGARVDRALDALELSPETRARVKDILESHFDEAFALRERIHSGEIGREEALAEHERIIAAAREALAPVLTAGEIQQLHEALHPSGVVAIRK